jgi:hypothetical protein
MALQAKTELQVLLVLLANQARPVLLVHKDMV